MAIAIGDIHGCLAPLRRLVERLPEGEALIFLGDYIDRGPDPAAVVQFLKSLARRRPCRFLKGNHEDMMLRAVDSKEEISPWLWNGGAATLRSYGVEATVWKRSAHRGEILERDWEFYSSLELYIEDENTIFVHAGIDLQIPHMARQKPEVLLWIRERFFAAGHIWNGKEIIFGHTPTRFMGLPAGEIFKRPPLYGIDTGCVYGGMLTAIDSRRHTCYQEQSDFRYD